MRAMGKVLLDLKQFVGPEDVSEFGGDSLWYSVGEFSVLSIDSSHDTIVSSSIDPMATYQEGLNEMKGIFEKELWGSKNK